MNMIENADGEMVEAKGPGPSGSTLVGEPRNSTIRQLIKSDYGYDSLTAAAEARDLDVLDRVRLLLVHRGYDDPIVLQENEDGYDEILKG